MTNILLIEQVLLSFESFIIYMNYRQCRQALGSVAREKL
jgi:hypothetical protein